MSSYLIYAYRDSFTQAAGSAFNEGNSLQSNGTGIDGGAEYTSTLRYTATVGTSYERIYNVSGVGDDNFGTIGQVDCMMIVNRSTTDTLTLRFPGALGDNAYVTIPASRHFLLYGAVCATSVSASDFTIGQIDAKFTSANGTIEVVGISYNNAYS